MVKPLLPADLPAVQRLRELFSYDRETGVVTRLIPRGDQRAGAIAGSLGNQGYMKVSVDGRHLLLHRVIWAMETGAWPADEIDHRNGVRSDNRWLNLREANVVQQRQNRKRSKLNTSGLVGATRTSDKKRWRSSIRANGVRLFLGNFPTAEAAHAAYVEAKARLHPFQPTVRALEP